MSVFEPTEWIVLGSIAAMGVLACLKCLGAEASKEYKMHQLKVRAAQLRIAQIRAMRELQEPMGVDIVDDEDDVVDAEVIEDEVMAEEIVDAPDQDSIPAAA